METLDSAKIKVFLWPTVNETLPVGSQLMRRKIVHAAIRGSCGALESITHALFECC